MMFNYRVTTLITYFNYRSIHYHKIPENSNKKQVSERQIMHIKSPATYNYISYMLLLTIISPTYLREPQLLLNTPPWKVNLQRITKIIKRGQE